MHFFFSLRAQLRDISSKKEVFNLPRPETNDELLDARENSAPCLQPRTPLGPFLTVDPRTAALLTNWLMPHSKCKKNNLLASPDKEQSLPTSLPVAAESLLPSFSAAEEEKQQNSSLLNGQNRSREESSDSNSNSTVQDHLLPTTSATAVPLVTVQSSVLSTRDESQQNPTDDNGESNAAQPSTSTGSESSKFQCDVCGNCYTSKYALVYHMNIHTSEAKPHGLGSSEIFKGSNNLRKHRKTQSAPRKNECPYCHNTFSSLASCRRHWEGDTKRNIACKVRRIQKN